MGGVEAGRDAYNIAGDYIAAAASATSLHQLRSPVNDFTGRGEELDKLLAGIERGGVTISGVRGMGGIGKTELALKLAEQLTDRFPDAQFYLDLKGTAEKPLTASEAMAHVIRGYRPQERLPDDENALGAIYRSVLHGQRGLILMDNASGADQVQPLIPPAGCVLLVTSRAHFALPGLDAVDLDTMPPGDAAKLLLRICKRIGSEEAGRIAELCGCLPLGLRLAGSALSERRDLSPADYTRRLTDEQTRLKQLPKVDASISLSDALLPDELRTLWYALAVFPGDFDAPAAAAVWEREKEAGQDALSDLVRYSVLDWSESTRRYRLHDLVRLYVADHLESADRQTAARRHATHYLQVARACDRLYEQGHDDFLRALKLFDLEWLNIQTGFNWSRMHTETDPGAASLCCDYPDAGAYCLSLRQHPRDGIEWLEAALAAARRVQDRSAEAGHLGNLGIAYNTLGDPPRAIEFHGESLEIMREIGRRRGEGETLGNLGIVYEALGDPRRAIEFHGQSLEIAREIGNRRGQGNALGNLGSAHMILGEPRRAIEFYKQSLEIMREIGNRLAEGAALGNLGIAYKSLGDARRAIEFYEQALEIKREIGDRAGESETSWNLGGSYAQQGDKRRAVELTQVYVDYLREIGHADAEKRAAQVERLRDEINDAGEPR